MRDLIPKGFRKMLIAAIVATALATVVAWICRYHALYYYYLWRLNSTAYGSEIIYSNINSISPHIVNLLVGTYVDVSASDKSRLAAAKGLVTASRDLAETIFIKFLDNTDEHIVASAIFHLSIMPFDKPFDRIKMLVNSPSNEIRLRVTYYLGNFNNEESISILQEMMISDSDAAVRDWAACQLQRLGVLPSN